MLDDMRRPFFILAMVLIGIAMLLEMGSPMVVGLAPVVKDPALNAHAEGFGVPSLAVLDALVILTVGLMGASFIVPERVQGRVQGLIMLIVSVLVFIASIVLLFMGIQLVTVMVGLLLAPFFGTIAYFAIWGHFDKSGAAAILSLLMLLKIGFAVSLVIAQQRFLQNKGLVLLIATSLVAVLIVSFLHGFVPGFLVSITDMVGAIVVAAVTLLWSFVFVIGSLISIFKAIV